MYVVVADYIFKKDEKMKKFLVIASLVFASSTFASGVKFDAGFGVNYGGIVGVTVNKKVAPMTELFGGLGAVGYVVGGRYYLNKHIRFIGNYGTNTNVITSYTAGINMGAEYVWNRWSAGLMYVVTSDGLKIDTDSDIIEKFRLSLGYRF